MTITSYRVHSVLHAEQCLFFVFLRTSEGKSDRGVGWLTTEPHCCTSGSRRADIWQQNGEGSLITFDTFGEVNSALLCSSVSVNVMFVLDYDVFVGHFVVSSCVESFSGQQI